MDIKNENFELKEDSPAFKLGFKAIDMSEIGLRKASYPEYLLKFNVQDIDNRKPHFHRNREDQEIYDFW